MTTATGTQSDLFAWARVISSGKTSASPLNLELGEGGYKTGRVAGPGELPGGPDLGDAVALVVKPAKVEVDDAVQAVGRVRANFGDRNLEDRCRDRVFEVVDVLDGDAKDASMLGESVMGLSSGATPPDRMVRRSYPELGTESVGGPKSFRSPTQTPSVVRGSRRKVGAFASLPRVKSDPIASAGRRQQNVARPIAISGVQPLGRPTP